MAAHTRYIFGVFVAALIAGCAGTTTPRDTGVERMYVLYCGEGNAPDMSRWTPGVKTNEGKPITLSNSCYLIKHAKGWMLWETGYSESITGNAKGYPTAVLHWYWRGPRSLTQQLAELGLSPTDVSYDARTPPRSCTAITMSSATAR